MGGNSRAERAVTNKQNKAQPDQYRDDIGIEERTRHMHIAQPSLEVASRLYESASATT